MDKHFLLNELNNIENARRINRQRVANLVLENDALFPILLEIVFEIDNKTSIKAAWVLEFVCIQKLVLLAPHIDHFTENIGTVKFDSAVRPVAKICEFIAKDFTSKKESVFKEILTKKHVDHIVEAGFDWLISEHKVAVKAYTMNSLFLFGKTYDWVHEELKLILANNIAYGSPAYKARGKRILGLINSK